jgi:hypothetical protein
MAVEADDHPHANGYSLEPSGQASGQCACCGQTTARIWGYLKQSEDHMAVYYVTWTEGRPDHGARFDLILGRWGEGTTEETRWHVSIEYRIVEHIPQFMIQDAGGGFEKIAFGKILRDEIIGTPIAEGVFAMLYAIYAGEERLTELRGWADDAGGCLE